MVTSFYKFVQTNFVFFCKTLNSFVRIREGFQHVMLRMACTVSDLKIEIWKIFIIWGTFNLEDMDLLHSLYQVLSSETKVFSIFVFFLFKEAALLGELSEYEKKRNDNIKRQHMDMQKCGLVSFWRILLILHYMLVRKVIFTHQRVPASLCEMKCNKGLETEFLCKIVSKLSSFH